MFDHKRPDAREVEKLPTMRRFMPFIMRTRADAVLFFDAKIEVGDALRWLDAHNAESREQVTFFQLCLWSMARTVYARPRINRYVKGRRIYQRERVSFTFSVKKGMDDDAHLTTVKVTFEPDDDLQTIARRIRETIARGREKRETKAEKKMVRLERLPAFAVAAGVRLHGWLDANNLLPASMMTNDPLYTTAMVTNVGSIGIDSVFHHLNEWGTASIVASVGKIHDEPVVRDGGRIEAARVTSLKMALDDRICDGYYFARTIDLLSHNLSHPWELAGEPAPERAQSRQSSTTV